MSLKGFPRRTHRGDRALYRIHRTGRAAWWFSTDGSGRFDPVGTGHGACYLAASPLGAWVEVFRKTMLLADATIAARRLFSVTLGRDLRLADVTARRALGFGVTASLGADEDYGPSQHFAARALQAGYDGVRYLARHDPAQRLYAVAVFGDSAAWPAGVDEPISAALIEDAQRTFGYRVLPAP